MNIKPALDWRSRLGLGIWTRYALLTGPAIASGQVLAMRDRTPLVGINLYRGKLVPAV